MSEDARLRKSCGAAKMWALGGPVPRKPTAKPTAEPVGGAAPKPPEYLDQEEEGKG